MAENGEVQPETPVRKGNREWEEARRVAFLAEFFEEGRGDVAQCRDGDAAISEFIPDFNPGEYDEDSLEVFRRIVRGINRLRETSALHRAAEARPFTLNLKQCDWDANTFFVLSQIEHAIEQLWAALEDGEPLPSADYVFKFDTLGWHEDMVKFLRQVEATLNGLRKQQRFLSAANSQHTGIGDSQETPEWPHGFSPAADWEARATQRVLDELFCFARQYRSSKSYEGLLKFVAGFRSYSPYNAMLVRTQMEGARFVAPAHRWSRKYGRTIKVNARPLVILQPMGPVMFVFDVSDTEPGPHAKPLPPEVDKPFEARRGCIGGQWDTTIENAKRDGIRIQPRKEGSQSGGSIRQTDGGKIPLLVFNAGKDKHGNPKQVEVPVRYDILFNEIASKESRYATIAHELAHLYCGHLGTPNAKWWPDRRGLDLQTEEFEAESVAYLVCGRLGIDNPSEKYLAGYFNANAEVPNISIDVVMKAAWLIERMGKERMKPREAGE